MPGLDASLSLKRAWDYSAPRRPSDALPLVYGEMGGGEIAGGGGGGGGLWNAVCLNAAERVYALAGHPLLPIASGNQVRLFDQTGALIDPAGYSLNLAHDYQGQGLIATATFAADQGAAEPLGVRAQGKPDQQGDLIVNPLAVAIDILLTAGGFSEDDLDSSAYGRAWSRAQALSFRAAGAVVAPLSAASLLTEIMSDFLGSWWQGADGRIKLMLDLGPGSLDEGELAASLAEAHLKDVSVLATLANLVNRAPVYYAYNRLSESYEVALDGGEGQDLASQGLYGLAERQLGLKWVRDSGTAAQVGRRLVALLSTPRRIITCEEDALTNLPLERGDAALLSLSWLGDELGRPLVNQIVRVLSMEPQLDQGVIRFTLLDTGFYKTLARIADGSLIAQGPALAGGERDRREY